MNSYAIDFPSEKYKYAYCFFVPGLPKGQPRPRAFARKLADGRAIARVYDAGTAEGWKSQIALAAERHLDKRTQGSYRLALTFYLPRPKSHLNSKGAVKPSAPIYPGKPDIDNLAKAAIDALVTIGLVPDDSLLVSLSLWKLYAAPPSQSGLIVKVIQLTAPLDPLCKQFTSQTTSPSPSESGTDLFSCR